MSQRKFEFELDLDLPEEIIEDLEEQLLRETQRRFGPEIVGDDIKTFRFIFRAEVTMK